MAGVGTHTVKDLAVLVNVCCVLWVAYRQLTEFYLDDRERVLSDLISSNLIEFYGRCVSGYFHKGFYENDVKLYRIMYFGDVEKVFALGHRIGFDFLSTLGWKCMPKQYNSMLQTLTDRFILMTSRLRTFLWGTLNRTFFCTVSK